MRCVKRGVASPTPFVIGIEAFLAVVRFGDYAAKRKASAHCPNFGMADKR
jgi:hypothetical protein